MITRWHGLKTLSLLLFTTILYGCSSYLHEPKFNSQPFTLEDMLPPLAPLVPLSKGESRRHSNRWDSNYCASVPVVYTNDPETISLWLSENVPGGESGIIGFDTEVRKSSALVLFRSSFECYEDCWLTRLWIFSRCRDTQSHSPARGTSELAQARIDAMMFNQLHWKGLSLSAKLCWSKLTCI